MSDLLLDLKEYIMANTAATDVFIDFEPEAPDSIVVLNEYRGGIPPLNDVAIARSVQILARGETPEEARTMCKNIFKALDKADRYVELTAARWSLVYPRQFPFKIKIDNNNRVYYGFNVSITSTKD